MKVDPHNCRHEYQQELSEEAKRAHHIEGECGGVPICDWCIEEQLGEGDDGQKPKP